MYQMQATFNAKTLNNALQIVRKGAKIRTGENWLETSDHKYGTDHVFIRIVNGDCTLYTVSQPGEGQACTFVRCDRLAHVAYIDGELALPIRTLHDYVKTFSASDEIRIAGDDVRVVEDTAASHTYHTEANTYKRIRTEIPATYRDEYAIIVTSGRNRARIIGKPLTALAWMGDALLFGQVTPTEQAAADHAALLASIKPVRVVAQPATNIMHGPAYVAPLGNPPGIMVPDDMPLYELVRIWMQHIEAQRPVFSTAVIVADESDADVNAIIEAITGEQYVQDDPTPIYAPAVGTFVHLMYRHSDGRTTERVVNVKSVLHMPEYFRGYDVRYGKMRNYHTASIVWMREWNREAICDMQGREVVAAYAA